MPPSDLHLNRILDACQEQAIALFDQWNQERKYERLNAYGNILRPLLAQEGAQLVNIVTAPFGVHFVLEDAHFILKVTRKTVGIYELKPTQPTIEGKPS